MGSDACTIFTSVASSITLVEGYFKITDACVVELEP